MGNFRAKSKKSSPMDDASKIGGDNVDIDMMDAEKETEVHIESESAVRLESSESINESMDVYLTIIGKIMKDMEMEVGSSKGKEKMGEKECKSGEVEFSSGEGLSKSSEEEFKSGEEGFKFGEEKFISDEESFKSCEEKENSDDDENLNIEKNEKRFGVVDQYGESMDKATFEKYYEVMFEGLFDESAEDRLLCSLRREIHSL